MSTDINGPRRHEVLLEKCVCGHVRGNHAIDPPQCLTGICQCKEFKRAPEKDTEKS